MYLQDVHVENYANRGKSMGMLSLKIFLIVLTVIFLLLGMFMPPVFLAAIGSGLLAWFVGTRSELDFDYSYTNGTIDVAKVYTKSYRKHFLTVDMKDVVVVGPVGSDSVRAYQGRGIKTIDCSSRSQDAKTYEIVYHDTKSNNNAEVILLMDLEDDFLDAMSTVAPSAVHKN